MGPSVLAIFWGYRFVVQLIAVLGFKRTKFMSERSRV